MSDEDKISQVELLWKKQLKYYYENYENMLISLTGGNDSRISLALSKEYKDYFFFTYCKNPEYLNYNSKSDQVYNIDRLIVEEILKDFYQSNFSIITEI